MLHTYRSYNNQGYNRNIKEDTYLNCLNSEWQALLNDTYNHVKKYPSPFSLYPVSSSSNLYLNNNYKSCDFLIIPADDWQRWLPKYISACVAHIRKFDHDYFEALKYLHTYNLDKYRLLNVLSYEMIHIDDLQYIDSLMNMACRTMKIHCEQHQFTHYHYDKGVFCQKRIFYQMLNPTLDDYYFSSKTLSCFLHNN